MRVLLDDRECDVQARSVDQAIAAGAALAEQNGRLIVEVQVDGAPWSDAPPGTPHGEALVQPQEVRLTSAEPRILVGQTLADASEALTGIDDAQREAAELIEADRLPEGMERLGEALRTWDELRQVIAMSAQALDLKLDEMTVGGASVPSIIDALGQQLARCRRRPAGEGPGGPGGHAAVRAAGRRAAVAGASRLPAADRRARGRTNMPVTGGHKKLDELREKALQALNKQAYFAAERHAFKGVGLAQSTKDFEYMASLVPLLRDARMGRLAQAMAIGRVTVVDEPVEENIAIEPGCYLVRPPQVGADARRLRLQALEQEISIAVVCVEPITQLRLLPVVAICPGTTLRTKIDPPDDINAPDLEWFAYALQELGDCGLESVDPEKEAVKRVEALLDRLNALPEHERLHDALVEACLLVGKEG